MFDKHFCAGLLCLYVLLSLIVFATPTFIFDDHSRAYSTVFFIIAVLVGGLLFVGSIIPENKKKEDKPFNRIQKMIFFCIILIIGAGAETAFFQRYQHINTLSEKRLETRVKKLKTYCTKKLKLLETGKLGKLKTWWTKRRLYSKAMRGKTYILLLKKYRINDKIFTKKNKQSLAFFKLCMKKAKKSKRNIK